MWRWGLLLLLASAAPAWAQPDAVRLTTWLRAGPGEGYAVLDQIDARTPVDVLGCDAGWCRVAVGAATGYVRAAIFTAPDLHRLPSVPADPACVTARLNGRPSTGDPVRVCGP